MIERITKEKTVILTGECDYKERDAFIKALGPDGDIRIGLMSMKATAMGITLEKCTFIVIVENAWHGMWADQSASRSRRAGLTHPVHVFRLYLARSPDEKLYCI